MRYAYTDLGRRREGDAVLVNLRGTSANVIVLDARNFASYRAGQAFLYEGGYFTRSPVEIEIPEDDHWYVVVDLGGHRGRVKATVAVRAADAQDPDRDSRASLALS